MATTTNFGWATPDDTALVKDGAAAIRTLGSSIDTSMAKLKGGTAGQVLSKTNGTDMDFTWVAVDPLTILDAKGDLISATAADTPARLPVGTNGQVLKADSTTSTGLAWGSVAATKNFTLLNGTGTTMSGTNSVTITGLGGNDQLFIYIAQASTTTSYGDLVVRFNGDSGSNYNSLGMTHSESSPPHGARIANALGTEIQIASMGNSADNWLAGSVAVYGAANTGAKPVQVMGASNGVSNQAFTGMGRYLGTSAISSVTIYNTPGYNFDSGTIYVYGAA